MERLRVVTLNIWNRQGPWRERLPLIRDGLAALAPDVVGLQEVLGAQRTPEQVLQDFEADYTAFTGQ